MMDGRIDGGREGRREGRKEGGREGGRRDDGWIHGQRNQLVVVWIDEWMNE